MSDTRALLAEYVKNGSEPAFRELVRRYLSLVYSTALRIAGGDIQLAEDIAQTVFVDLARKAGTLSGSVLLGGWLHRHTCFVGASIMRGERRRRARERQATEMSMLQNHPEPNLSALVTLLDDAINRLSEDDRAAVLLRFFEQQDFRSVGVALGSSEDAARMRVNRALERLHALLKRRGVTLSGAALGTFLTGEVVQAAPAGLAANISTAALAGVAGGAGVTLTLLNIMTATKLKLAVLTGLLAAGLAVPLVIQHQSTIRLREKDQALLRQQEQLARATAENDRLSRLLKQAKSASAPRLPAPALNAGAATNDALAAAQDIRSTNLMTRLLKGEWPRLTPEQIDAYLAQNRRDAGSLLAVFRATDDRAFLKEAEEKYPNDPRVAYAAMFKTDSPEERRQWADRFKESAPDNAMAGYLSALDYFKSGQSDQAVQELMATPAKQQFQDYSWDFVQNAEEAWRAAGYSEAESRMVATWQLMLPQLGELKGLNEDIMNLANSYRQSGDEASAQAMLQMNLNLGQQLAASPATPLISQLVGIEIESKALGAMDPASPYGDNGLTVQDYLNQLTQQKTTIHELVKQVEPLQETMTPQDWISYNDRTKSFGEVNAINWLLNKNSGK